MAERHEVRFSVPNRDLGNADIVFKAWDRSDEGFIGELRVSVGGVEWRGSRQRRTYTYRLNWTEFDDLLFKCASRRRRPQGARSKRRRATPKRKTKSKRR
jgi:hypothetical protein